MAERAIRPSRRRAHRRRHRHRPPQINSTGRKNKHGWQRVRGVHTMLRKTALAHQELGTVLLVSIAPTSPNLVPVEKPIVRAPGPHRPSLTRIHIVAPFFQVGARRAGGRGVADFFQERWWNRLWYGGLRRQCRMHADERCSGDVRKTGAGPVLRDAHAALYRGAAATETSGDSQE